LCRFNHHRREQDGLVMARPMRNEWRIETRAAVSSPMSFFKKLFGGGSAAAPDAAPAASEEHNGFTISATPYQENGQWQMCGVIEKEIAGERKSHRFVRADRFAGKDEAVQFTMVKARQIVDQMGDRVFG
jgi:hypothetical protein